MGSSLVFKIMSGIGKFKRNLKKLFGRTGGQSSLEFALVVPFIVLIILTVSHIGLMVYQKNVLEQAAREGARVVATTNSNTEACRAVRQVCSGLEQDRLGIDIDPGNKNSRKVGDMITITLSYKCSGIVRIMQVLMGKDMFLKVRSNMRMECY